MSSAEDRITKAKANLFLQQPFYATIIASMVFVEVEWCSTMATDGRYVYWNRKFVDGLSQEELTGVICHETLHAAWLHMLRGKGRDRRLANIAMDIVINQTLIEGGFKLPANGRDPKTGKEVRLWGPEWAKYKDWMWEDVYEDLLKNATVIKIKMPGTGEGGEPGEGEGDEMWGIVVDPKSDSGQEMSEAEKLELEQEMKIKIQQAAAAAKSIGKLPAGMEGLIEAAGKPKINWKDYIQNWVSGHTPDDYTWQRPNRKIMANYGIYMPSIKLNGAGVGVLSIDTSGSVSDDELREYVREIAGMIEMCNPERVVIIQHDAIIQKVEDWEAGEDFSSLKVKGRGGTNITPTFQKLRDLDVEPDWMIIFSDMEIGDWPKKELWPACPILLLSTGRRDTSPAGLGTYIPVRDAM
mgnify:CR=1 FL=1